MATIQKRITAKGDVRWSVKIRIQGFPPVSKTYGRKSDALQDAAAIEAKIRAHEYQFTQEAEKHTVSDMLDRYRKEVEKDFAKVRAGLPHHLDWFNDNAGKYNLTALSPSMVAELRDKLASEEKSSRKTRSPATVNRYLATLSHCISLAVNEWGWMHESPMRKVRRKLEPKGRVRFLSDDERGRLLTACQESSNPHIHPVVLLAISTGMRQSEIANLTWGDIDLSREWILLEETKNGERRGVPLAGPALNALRELAGGVRRIDGRIFPPLTRTGQGWLRKSWLRAVGKAGIEDFKFHDLRHTAASYMLMSGAGIQEIADLLGHKTLAMVQRYSHLADEHRSKVVARMNEQFLSGGEQ